MFDIIYTFLLFYIRFSKFKLNKLEISSKYLILVTKCEFDYNYQIES
jgi:hypothetical protein